MNDNPISAVAAGGRTALGGVAACWAGLEWGYAIATGQWPWELSGLEWMTGWMGAGFMAFFGAAMSPVGDWPGFLVLPFVLAMLYGAVGREWNRWIVAGVLAVVVGGLGYWVGVFECEEWGVSVAQAGVALAVVLFGTAQERGWLARLWWRLFPPQRGDEGGGGKSDE